MTTATVTDTEMAVETLRQIYATAAAYYQRHLEEHARVQAWIGQTFGLTPARVQQLGLGYAPDGRAALLVHLQQQGFHVEDIEASRLVLRDDLGGWRDRFLARLIIPIRGSAQAPREGIDLGHEDVVAFAGRAVHADQVLLYMVTPATALATPTPRTVSLAAQAIKDPLAAEV